MTAEFLGVTTERWLWALGVLVVTFVGVKFVVGLTAAYARRIASRTQTDVDDLIAALLHKTAVLFVLLIAVWAASRSLDLPTGVALAFTRALKLGVILQGGFWITGIVQYLIVRFAKDELENDPSVASALGAVRVVATMGIWIIVVLTALATFDVNVSALVAGLGVGGIAIALAVQNILGDLFGAVTILLDKPFQVGDYIVVGSSEGTVEHIGLKTTRLVSLTGEQLVIGNADLLSSRIYNHKRREERRAAFQIEVEYGTSHADAGRISDILEEIVTAQEKTRFDRAHLKSFGASGLVYEVVYWMTVPQHRVHMDTLEAINLAIYKRFSEEGIEFAFPSQTLYLRRDGSAPAAPAHAQPTAT